MKTLPRVLLSYTRTTANFVRLEGKEGMYRYVLYVPPQVLKPAAYGGPLPVLMGRERLPDNRDQTIQELQAENRHLRGVLQGVSDVLKRGT